MADAMLELWLRLLALHLPEPVDDRQRSLTFEIRNQWLLASQGFFGGCVPHGMDDACSTEEGTALVRSAISSLLLSLQSSEAALDAPTLNLLGIDGQFTRDIPAQSMRDVAHAFLDLLDGNIRTDASTTDTMPGSKPYERALSKDSR